jgi:hypothetical protein
VKAPLFDQDLGLAQGIKSSPLKSSSRNRALRLSQYPLSQGLSGSMSAVLAPKAVIHNRRAKFADFDKVALTLVDNELRTIHGRLLCPLATV